MSFPVASECLQNYICAHTYWESIVKGIWNTEGVEILLRPIIILLGYLKSFVLKEHRSVLCKLLSVAWILLAKYWK